MRVALLAAFLCAVFPVCSLAGQTSLPDLERRVDDAYSVKAAALHAQAAASALDASRAVFGWKYVFSNSIGPRADQVTQNGPKSTYSQNLGYQAPVFGSRSDEKNRIYAAVRDTQIAAAQLALAKRTAVSTLRGAYVHYWLDDGLVALSQSFLARADREDRAVHALVHAGFWTPAQLLGFEEMRRRVRDDGNAASIDQLSQLAAMRAIVGETGHFNAVAPAIANCSDRNALLRAAEHNDFDIAQEQAEIEDFRGELGTVKRSSVTGTVAVTAGTSLDAATAHSSRTTAYSINAGTTLTMPVHARSEERAQRAMLSRSLEEQQALIAQRQADIASLVDAGLDAGQAASLQLSSARLTATEKAEALRVAIKIFETQRMTTHPLLADILAAETDKYVADQAALTAAADVQLRLSALEDLAPDACNAPQ